MKKERGGRGRRALHKWMLMLMLVVGGLIASSNSQRVVQPFTCTTWGDVLVAITTTVLHVRMRFCLLVTNILLLSSRSKLAVLQQ